MDEPTPYQKSVYAHKDLVKESLHDMALELGIRAANHDLSKLQPEERDIYERVTPEFQGVTYGTPEYEAVKAKLGPALEHHYQVNDHHPEHFEHGVEDMNAMQFDEMIADWYAAIRRDPNADLTSSLEALRVKYNLEPQTFAIVKNTIFWLKNGAWLSPRQEAPNRGKQP